MPQYWLRNQYTIISEQTRCIFLKFSAWRICHFLTSKDGFSVNVHPSGWTPNISNPRSSLHVVQAFIILNRSGYNVGRIFEGIMGSCKDLHRFENGMSFQYDTIWYMYTLYTFCIHPTRWIVYSASCSGNLEGYFWRCLRLFRGGIGEVFGG